MKCDAVQERLSAYVDGELPSEEEPPVVRHLEDCEQCAAIAEEYRGLRGLLEHQRVPDPPDTMKANVMAAIKESNSEPQRSPSDTATGGRLAAAAVFLVGILLGLAVQIATFPVDRSPNRRILDANRSTSTVMEVRPTGSLSELLNRESQSQSGGQP